MAITIDGAGTITGLDADGISSQPVFAGNVLQVVQGVQATTVSLANNNTYTDTGLEATITPSSNGSKILILVSQQRFLQANSSYFSYRSFTRLMVGLTQLDEKLIELGSGNSSGGFNRLAAPTTFAFIHSPNTTSAVIYKTQIKGMSTGGTIERADAGSTITLMEIAG